MRRFESQTVIVTGGGRGIGAATAKVFAQEGANVVVTSRTRNELDEVIRSIEAAGARGRALGVVCDIADESSVVELFRQATEKFGAVDYLINNAGAIDVREFADIDAVTWDRIFAVNVRGPFLCSREMFRQCKSRKKGGAIVNISSLSGIRGTEKFKGFSSYIAAKHAVVGLTESLAVEGREYGIRVNCVAPGAVATAMLQQAAPFLKTSTRPEDIAPTILFLCDDAQSRSLSGAIIEVHSNQ